MKYSGTFLGVVLSVGSMVRAELAVNRDEGVLAVRGGHFRLNLDMKRGGEISELELHDGSQWNRVFSAPAITFPMLRFSDRKDTFAFFLALSFSDRLRESF